MTLPEQGLVTVDGSEVSASPAIFELAPGAHTVEVLWADGRTATRSVQLGAGAVITLSVAAPTAAPAAGTVRVEFVPQGGDIAVHLRTGTQQVPGMMSDGRGGAISVMHSIAQYDRLCEAPCTVDLPTGHLRLALSFRGGNPVEVRVPVELRRDGRLGVSYADYHNERVAGWTALGFGVAGGLGLGLAGLLTWIDDLNGPNAVPIGLGVSGGIVLIAAVAIGLGFGLKRDAATIQPLAIRF